MVGRQSPQSSISTKLSIAFAAIVLLTSLSLFLGLNSLNKTRATQQRLTQETLPLLKLSNEFSQSLFEYLTLLERISISQSDGDDLRAQITSSQSVIKSQLRHIQDITQGSLNIGSVAGLLDQMLINSNTLQTLVFEERRRDIRAVDKQKEMLELTLSDMRREIRRHRMLKRNSDALINATPISIDNELVHIDETIGQYRPRLNTDDLNGLQERYSGSVRNIAQDIQLFQDDELREKLAVLATQFYEQVASNSGFFARAQVLSKNFSEASRINLENKKIEQDINLELGRLLDDVGIRADREIAKFDALIQRNIVLIAIIMAAMIILAFVIQTGFVVPKIARRLERLADDTRRISSGNYSETIDTSGTDEIAEIANALNGFQTALIEKLETESERERLLVQLRNANEELEQFTYRSSHDLKAPLTRTKRICRLVIKDIENGKLSEAARNVELIQTQMGSLEILVEDLMSLAKADLLDTEVESYQFSEVVEDLKTRLGTLFQDSGVRFEAHFDQTASITCDPVRLMQVLENLVSNSCKYADMEAQEPWVKLSFKQESNHYSIMVEDNGLGIPEQYRSELFERFTRFHPSVNVGSGLGLSIVKKHIDKMAGNIRYEPRDTGSRFIMSLPL